MSNVGNFLLGVKTSDGIYRWLSFYNGNTHNSFLMLHAKFGLLAFVLLMILISVVIRKAIKEKKGIFKGCDQPCRLSLQRSGGRTAVLLDQYSALPTVGV